MSVLISAVVDDEETKENPPWSRGQNACATPAIHAPERTRCDRAPLNQRTLAFENHPTLHYLTRTQTPKPALQLVESDIVLVERQDTFVLVPF